MGIVVSGIAFAVLVSAVAVAVDRDIDVVAAVAETEKYQTDATVHCNQGSCATAIIVVGL